MRVVWAMVGTALAIAISCSEPEEAGGGTFQAGGAAGSAAGGSGGKGGSGGSATGGTRPGGSGGEDGGAAGSSGDGSAGGGAGGEGPCECSGDPNVPDPEVQCSVPLELLCLPDDPFGCPTTLGVAIANVADHCDDDEFGTRADCDDGTTELEYWEPWLDSTHRLVFDDRGTLIGRYYYGSAYFGVYNGVCGGAGDFDFLEYQGGELPTGNCEPSCSLCADGDLPTCEP